MPWLCAYVERSLRAVSLGCKNFMFVGSDAGGHRAAALYSLIGSATLDGLDPEACLRNLLSQICGLGRDLTACLLSKAAEPVDHDHQHEGDVAGHRRHVVDADRSGTDDKHPE